VTIWFLSQKPDLFQQVSRVGGVFQCPATDRIIPELQEIKVGDSIRIFDRGPFEVATLEPNRLLVLLARVDWDTEETFELSDTMSANYLNNGWVYVLEEVDEHTTRLIVRWRGDYSPGLGNALALLGIPTDPPLQTPWPVPLRQKRSLCRGNSHKPLWSAGRFPHRSAARRQS
jgi:hypothetical protein